MNATNDLPNFILEAEEKVRDCAVPKHFWGDYYSYDKLDNFNALITIEGIQTNAIENGVCKEISIYEDSYDTDGNFDARILFFDA